MRCVLSVVRHAGWTALLLAAAVGGCNKSDEPGPGPATTPAAQPAATQPAAAQVQTPQTSGAEAVTPSPQAGAHPSTQPGKIAPGDLLSLRVFDLAGPGLDSVKPVRVAADGTVQPFYLDPLHVAGLSDADAEGLIVKAYHEANIIAQGVVLVRRLQVAPAGEDAAEKPIGNFDLVRVAVGELSGPASETVVVTRVDGDGVVGLPYVGKVKLAGLNDQKAEKAVAREYNDQHIVQHPQVSVLRLEAAPSDASRVDLPDLPLRPVPEFLKPFYQDGQLGQSPPAARGK